MRLQFPWGTKRDGRKRERGIEGELGKGSVRRRGVVENEWMIDQEAALERTHKVEIDGGTGRRIKQQPTKDTNRL